MPLSSTKENINNFNGDKMFVKALKGNLNGRHSSIWLVFKYLSMIKLIDNLESQRPMFSFATNIFNQ